MLKMDSLITDLHGQCLQPLLESRLHLLEVLLQRKKGVLKTLEAEIHLEMAKMDHKFQTAGGRMPAVRVCSRGKSFQYYILTEKGDNSGIYISRKKKLVQKLVQYNYLQKVVEATEAEATILKSFLSRWTPLDYMLQFNRLHPGKKALAENVFETDEEYINRWRAGHKKETDYYPEGLIFETAAGENVRSKSEVLIADELNKAQIPYIYEAALTVTAGGRPKTLHPDFTLLDVANRREVIWEHFGLMDNPEYAAAAAEKIKIYENSSLASGKTFFFTMETKAAPLLKTEIQRIISCFKSAGQQYL